MKKAFIISFLIGYGNLPGRKILILHLWKCVQESWVKEWWYLLRKTESKSTDIAASNIKKDQKLIEIFTSGVLK